MKQNYLKFESKANLFACILIFISIVLKIVYLSMEIFSNLIEKNSWQSSFLLSDIFFSFIFCVSEIILLLHLIKYDNKKQGKQTLLIISVILFLLYFIFSPIYINVGWIFNLIISLFSFAPIIYGAFRKINWFVVPMIALGINVALYVSSFIQILRFAFDLSDPENLIYAFVYYLPFIFLFVGMIFIIPNAIRKISIPTSTILTKELLYDLKQQYDQHVITEEEYEKKRQEILNKLY